MSSTETFCHFERAILNIPTAHLTKRDLRASLRYMPLAPHLETENAALRSGELTRTSPPLKWAGGKRWLLPHLHPLWEQHKDRKLVEPFAGGLAVSLGLLPRKAQLNDINPHVVNFYQWLKKGLVIDISLRNEESHYYDSRARFNELISVGRIHTKEAASLFYYLNRTGYNGLCRFNQQGYFNVPFGRHGTINYTRDFSRYRDVFNKWKFSARDFEDIDIQSSDFMYADPPYDVPFTQYAKDDFSWTDQVRLAEWLVKHRGPVVISNQATPRIVKLYRSHGFRLRFLDAPRMISCNGNRSKAKEVLATRNL